MGESEFQKEWHAHVANVVCAHERREQSSSLGRTVQVHNKRLVPLLLHTVGKVGWRWGTTKRDGLEFQLVSQSGRGQQTGRQGWNTADTVSKGGNLLSGSLVKRTP